MEFRRQLMVLLWKNWLLVKKHKLMTCLEIFIPIFFSLILIVTRISAPLQEVDQITKYKNINIGVLNHWNESLSSNEFLKIGYAPKNPETEKLINYFEDITLTNLTGFFDDIDAVRKISDSNSSLKLSHLIVFEDITNKSTFLPKKLNYKIRPYVKLGKINVWDTELTYDPTFNGMARCDQTSPPYLAKGILAIQRAMGEAVIKYWFKNKSETYNADMNITTQAFPYPPYTLDMMGFYVSNLMPIFIVISFYFSFMANTKALIADKEAQLKDCMKLMGMTDSVYFSSWFITMTGHIFPGVFFIVLFCGVDFGYHKVLNFSDISMFIMLLLTYFLAFISFSFMISSFIHRGQYVPIVASILYIFSYVPYVVFKGTNSRHAKLLSGLFFNTGWALGANMFGHYEKTGEGCKWSNFYKAPSVDHNISMLDILMILLVDSFIHLLIFWYLGKIWPGAYGVPEPYNFCFKKTYWFPTQCDDLTIHTNLNQNTKFENEPDGLKAGIQIKNLRKVFGHKVAVHGTTLNMFEDQITVLLGHNGAGKTTTMSVITGLIPPTSGTAVVNGYDIVDNLSSVHQSLGFCPQHNILFPELTVFEHLKFYAKLKGFTGDLLNEILTTAKDNGLQNKINAQAKSLSGGMKRKLCVGIALIGGSKVVILDEMTAGMDPSARRQTWSVLQKARKGRTVLISTHYMDEADLLGDRIAIMHDGKVICCGTSYFLKKIYGAGYHLIIVKKNDCDVEILTDVIQSHVASAKLKTVINDEVSYILPDADSKKFGPLLRELETKKIGLRIKSYGISATDMEEVFLKVGDENNQNQTNKENALITDYEKETGFALVLSRMRGLFIKKAIISIRSPVVTLLQFLLPVTFICLAISIMNSIKTAFDSGTATLKFNLDSFEDPIIPYNDSTLFYKKQFDSFTLQKTSNISNWTLHGTGLERPIFNKRVIIGMELNSIGNETNATAYYNGYPLHAQPISLNYLMNTLLQYYMDSQDYSLHSAIQPFMDESSVDEKKDLSEMISTGIFNIFNEIGFSLQLSFFVYPLIHERKVGAKHMQIVSGVGPLTYWIPTLLWDMLTCLANSVLILIAYIAFSAKAYYEDNNWLIFILVIFAYGWGALPNMYAIQFAFKNPTFGLMFAVSLNMFFASTVMQILELMRMLKLIDYDKDLVNWFFLVFFPNSNLADCLVVMNSNYPLKDHIDLLGFEQKIPSGRRVRGIGYNLIIFLLSGIIYIAFVLLIENRVLQQIWYLTGGSHETGNDEFERMIEESEDDNDVANERKRVNANMRGNDNKNQSSRTASEEIVESKSDIQNKNTSLEDSTSSESKEKEAVSDDEPDNLLVDDQNEGSNQDLPDSLVLFNLFKKYGRHIAVDHVYLGVPDKECFGLLGQNGAGKTTIFKMITGDVLLSGGNAYLKGYNVKSQIKHVQARMGYCPQFDALIGEMTGRETLTMYARLRGVPQAIIEDVVNSLLDVLAIHPHSDKMSKKYSGGNKRKLSTAVSLVGDPPFIMLDEPSAGIDPEARRYMWNVLMKIRDTGRTLVLTSHSMEECDALCTRIAIMVNGRFKCLGSPQHLKNKFAQGFTLIVKTVLHEDGSLAPNEDVQQYIIYNIQAELFDIHQNYLHFQVPDLNRSIADVFDFMEHVKENMDIVDDYSISQTSLEQVFLSFTRSQAVAVMQRDCCVCCGQSCL